MEWISVKDRLPDYTCRVGRSRFATVFACINNKIVGEAAYEEGKWFFLGLQISSDQVTHWMPLPQPPKQEDTNGI